jgi:hypothetical protein
MVVGVSYHSVELSKRQYALAGVISGKLLIIYLYHFIFRRFYLHSDTGKSFLLYS